MGVGKDKMEINTAEQIMEKQFTKSQIKVIILLVITYLITLVFILFRALIPGMIFIAIHTIGWISFYFNDVSMEEDEVLLQNVEKYRNTYFGEETYHEEYEEETQKEVESMNLMDYELLSALQDKCRNQVEYIQNLEDKIEEFRDQIQEIDREKELVRNETRLELLLPVADEEKKISNLVGICAQVIDEYKEIAKKEGIAIEFLSKSESISTEIDENRMRVVFHNLIDNAMKYMKKKGGLYITISDLADTIFIVCKDEGVGIVKDELDHIFDMNYQGSNRVNGNGLGLTQVKAIIEYYQGTIFAKSSEGNGMAIYIQLPKHE